jgi:glutamate-1-semialdehyde 2,1-aminomutase
MPALLEQEYDVMSVWKDRTRRSRELYDRSCRSLPLGVGSNYRAMDPYPIFVDEAAGSRFWDVDGNDYIDFGLAFGALFVGHSHPAIARAVADQALRGTMYSMPHHLEYELAEELKRRFPMLDSFRFTNSGTEATMHALRAARVYTGRPKILKFEGGFHGCHEAVMASVKPDPALAGPAEAPFLVPTSEGIPAEFQAHTLVARFNDLDSVRRQFEKHPCQIAAVITEPALMNSALCAPEPGFLRGLQALCRERGALFVLDEVKTGCKVAPGGATELWNLEPDIVCLAKAIGGGLPLGAFGGRREVMAVIESLRSMHVGTYNTNPLCMRAGLAALTEVLTPEAYARTQRLNRRLVEGYWEILAANGLPWSVSSLGPVGVLHFTSRPPRNYREFAATDEKAWERYWFGMTNLGIHPQPHGSEEQWTISAQHTDEDIDSHLAAFEKVAPTLVPSI